MTAASRSLATAPWGARFASGLLLCYTTSRDTTFARCSTLAWVGPAVSTISRRSKHAKSTMKFPKAVSLRSTTPHPAGSAGHLPPQGGKERASK